MLCWLGLDRSNVSPQQPAAAPSCRGVVVECGEDKKSFNTIRPEFGQCLLEGLLAHTLPWSIEGLS